MFKQKNNAFTLIEVLLSTTIIASVLVSGFYAITYITIGKTRLVESTKIQKEAFYFSEKLFELVKSGGVIDFEEYFNRKIVGNTGATAFSSGHYSLETGFGNFGFGGNVGSETYGSLIYHCMSPDGASMGTGGCVSSNNSAGIDHDGEPQRFGQYATQFIDYNSDFDGDGGDEDNSGGTTGYIGDDDDKFLGQGPTVFDSNVNVHELYLISGDRLSRTFFRWNVQLDPERPATADCDFTTDPSTPTGDGCLGTVEFIKLNAADWGNDHDESSIDANGSQYDGITDTWLMDPRFAGGPSTVAGTGSINYREKLFPDSISVSDFEIFAYPHKDIDLAWKDSTSSINQSPYIRLKLTLMPSRKKRKSIRGTAPQVEVATTIALTDEFSQ